MEIKPGSTKNICVIDLGTTTLRCLIYQQDFTLVGKAYDKV